MLRKSSTSELHAAPQSALNRSAPSSSSKNEATVSPDMRAFAVTQPQKSTTKGKESEVQNPDSSNNKEMELIKSNSMLNSKHKRRFVKGKLLVEESEDAGDKRMSCTDCSGEVFHMQDLLQQKAERIIEEDIVALTTRKENAVRSFGNTSRRGPECCIHL